MNLEITAEDILNVSNRIDTNSELAKTYDNYGAEEAHLLSLALKELGWKKTPAKEIYSECSKATFEINLQKKGTKINILTSELFGKFMQISIR